MSVSPEKDLSPCSISFINAEVVNVFQGGPPKDWPVDADAQSFPDAALTADPKRAFHVSL